MKLIAYAAVAIALASTMASSVLARDKTAAATKPAATPGQDASKPPPAPPPPVAVHTEISRFDSWSVTCDDYAEPAKKHLCHADLQVAKAETGQVLFAWTIAPVAGGDFNALLQSPTGVVIGSGIEIHAGEAGTRKVAFSTCEPNRCTAAFRIEAGFMKSLLQTSVGQIVLVGSNGQRIELGLPLKGLDKAVAAFAQ